MGMFWQPILPTNLFSGRYPCYLDIWRLPKTDFASGSTQPTPTVTPLLTTDNFAREWIQESPPTEKSIHQVLFRECEEAALQKKDQVEWAPGQAVGSHCHLQTEIKGERSVQKTFVKREKPQSTMHKEKQR